eukprot:362706-Chlamydomonas_euryale.AAC.1
MLVREARAAPLLHQLRLQDRGERERGAAARGDDGLRGGPRAAIRCRSAAAAGGPLLAAAPDRPQHVRRRVHQHRVQRVGHHKVCHAHKRKDAALLRAPRRRHGVRKVGRQGFAVAVVRDAVDRGHAAVRRPAAGAAPHAGASAGSRRWGAHGRWGRHSSERGDRPTECRTRARTRCRRGAWPRRQQQAVVHPCDCVGVVDVVLLGCHVLGVGG